MAHLSLAVIATFPYIGACIVFVFQLFSPSLLQNRKHQKTVFSSNKHFKDVAGVFCRVDCMSSFPSHATAISGLRSSESTPQIKAASYVLEKINLSN